MAPMHRFTVSLLAFLGGLTLPHRSGRAELHSPARTESVAANDESAAPAKRDSKDADQGEREAARKQASDPGTNGKRDANEKKREGAPADPAKVAAGAANSKKTDSSDASIKKSGEGDGRSKKPASSTTAKNAAKGVPGWAREQPEVVKL